MSSDASRAWSHLLALPASSGLVVSEGAGAMQRRLLREGCYEATGAFRHVLSLPGPQALAWTEDPADGSVLAYALLRAFSTTFYAYVPDRIGAAPLGIVGAWVRPERRRRGHGTTVLAQLGTACAGLRPDGFVVFAEDRMVSHAQSCLPFLVLPRWANQQPNEQEVRRAVRWRGHLAQMAH